ncbi:MAG: T9SS type A sorting domain-containing protein [candidate division Zixibacteria bacterium]|nr:T9SS type A sorting domain-containing protein [candidate division Zixibacteria bacterium]
MRLIICQSKKAKFIFLKKCAFFSIFYYIIWVAYSRKYVKFFHIEVVMRFTKQLIIIIIAAALVSVSISQATAKKKGGLEPIPYDNPRANQEYFYQQRAYPGEIAEIPWGERWRAIEKLKADGHFQYDIVDTWTCDGPFNLSGRTIAMWIDPDDPSFIYVGAADGGIWKSEDAGMDWEPLSDFLPSIAVGAIAVHPADRDIVYIGTGEGTFNGDAVKGVGVLKTTNGGESWEMTGLNWEVYDGIGCHVLWIKPDNPDILVLGASDGTYRTTDAGESWERVGYTSGTALVAHPTDHNLLYLANGNAWGNGANGIYRSTDAGASWERLDDGLPPRGEIGFTSMAICESDPDVIYAGIAQTISHGSGLQGFYRTTDGGDSWELRAVEPNFYGGQGWYDNITAVQPDNPDIVYAGGIDLHKSTDGGQSWTQISWWYLDLHDDDYVHADQHAFAFDPSDPLHIWAAGDGGIYTSYDGGENWEMRNTNFATLQYYAIGHAPQNDFIVYGGSQDQGTTKWSGTGNWDYVFGGDGGYCVIDYTDHNIVYAEWQFGNHVKTENGGYDWIDIMNGIEEQGAWVTPVAMDHQDHNILYTSTNKIYKTDNGGWFWEPVSNTLGGTVVTLSQSPVNPDLVWVGINSGRVWKGYPWDEQWELVNDGLPNRYCTRVVADLFDEDVAYATYSGYNNSTVFRTSDGGESWHDITGDLPLIPVNDLDVDPYDPNHLFVATDVTVMHTIDLGEHWEPYGSGLPHVFINDILIDSYGNLRAGTHGRGMWSTSILTSVPEERTADLPYDFRIDAPYPNPFNPGAKIGFALKHSGTVKIEVINIMGQKVRTLVDKSQNAGFHTVIWDGRDNSGSGVSSGIYLFRMEFDGKSKVVKGTMVK